MNSESDDTISHEQEILIHGTGSVAHQIIGEFLSVLERAEGYSEIAESLRKAIFEGKVTESSLRVALFGSEPL